MFDYQFFFILEYEKNKILFLAQYLEVSMELLFLLRGKPALLGTFLYYAVGQNDLFTLFNTHIEVSKEKKLKKSIWPPLIN